MNEPTTTVPRRTPQPEDRKPVPPREPAFGAPESASWTRISEGAILIPVKLIKWEPGQMCNEMRAKSGKEPNGEIWAIDYLPEWRQFRIVHTDTPQRASKVRTQYVPVERCMSWEPA